MIGNSASHLLVGVTLLYAFTVYENTPEKSHFTTLRAKRALFDAFEFSRRQSSKSEFCCGFHYFRLRLLRLTNSLGKCEISIYKV